MANPRPAPPPPLTPAAITAAHAKISPYIHRTPLITSTTLDSIASSPDPAAYLRDPAAIASQPIQAPPPATPHLCIHLKLENAQKTGSFKARGAFHALTSVSASASSLSHLRARGVATQSSGNHAQALALAARTFDVPAYIVMPRVTSANKVAATRAYGAEVVFCEGHTVRDREQGLEAVVRERGCVVVPPYDDQRVILGQGTVGREIEGQFREGQRNDKGGGEGKGRLDAIVAPVSGGGLLGGIATWFGDKPGTRVFGAEPSFQGANDVERGLKQGKRVESVDSVTIAEGCRGVVGLRNWEIISDKTKVEAVYIVTEEEILMAMRLLFERVKTVVEPSGAVALAMVLFNQEWRSWVAEQQEGKIWNVTIVLSGGNTTMDAITKLFPK